jgi:hypothetical protein
MLGVHAIGQGATELIHMGLKKKMVGATGFEPVTTRTPSVCATRLRYAPTGFLG